MHRGDGSRGVVRWAEASDLSICRNPAPSASSRSKAVDSKAAHSFQTGRCNSCVFPVSDKPDRFYCYDDYDKYCFCKKKNAHVLIARRLYV